MFKIETVPLCPGKILQTYQADEISEINIAGKFLVKTKDREFNTTIYPFLQTDYLFDQLTGKANDQPIINLRVQSRRMIHLILVL